MGTTASWTASAQVARWQGRPGGRSRRPGRAAAVVAGCLLALAGCSPTNGGGSDGAGAGTVSSGTVSSGTVSSDAGATRPPLPPLTDVGATARALAGPVRACVPREDSPHPVFHGCVDWHSAVHGNYALRVASRLTGDRTFAAVADSVVTEAGMALVRDAVVAGRLPHEVPYGYAWFLILDQEARTPGTAAVAAAVSTRLRAWVDAHLDGEGIGNAEYDNVSFPVFALHRWYLRADPRQAAGLRRAAIPRLAAGAEVACRRGTDRNTGFFDPCATLLLALADARDADAAAVPAEDLDAVLPVVLEQPPLGEDDLAVDHAGGLNFSRSWSLYAAARALGRRDLVDVGDRYVQATFTAPSVWQGDYLAHAHWVAQFGLHALDLRQQAVDR